MSENPFEIKIVAAKNDEISARENHANEKSAAAGEVIFSAGELENLRAARVQKIYKIIIISAVILVFAAVGWGVFSVIRTVSENSASKKYEKTLDEMKNNSAKNSDENSAKPAINLDENSSENL